MIFLYFLTQKVWKMRQVKAISCSTCIESFSFGLWFHLHLPRPSLSNHGPSWDTPHQLSHVWASVRRLTASLNMIKAVSNSSAQPVRLIITSLEQGQSISDQYEHACECMAATSHSPAQRPSRWAWVQSRATNVEMRNPAAFWDELLGLQEEMLAEKKQSIME